jgi:hypothetical protein
MGACNTGIGIVVASVVDVSETLGSSMPLLELTTSSIADTSGLLPVVLIAMFCAITVLVKAVESINSNMADFLIRESIVGFILFSFTMNNHPKGRLVLELHSEKDQCLNGALMMCCRICIKFHHDRLVDSDICHHSHLFCRHFCRNQSGIRSPLGKTL